MAATKVYEIADGTAITSKGVILVEGQEVTKDDFLSEEVFNELVKAKKIVQVTSTGKKPASTGKKPASTGKAASTPTSSTGAVDAEAEDTNPKSDSKDDSDKGGDAGNDAGDAQ